MKTLSAIAYAIGAVANFYSSRALSQTLRDIEHCEDRELSIQEQINEFTESKRYNRSNPDHRNHLGALHRWLQQWQERKTSFDQ